MYIFVKLSILFTKHKNKLHKNKLRDPQSGALIYTVVRWSVMHLQEYDHVINLANQAAQLTKPTPNITPLHHPQHPSLKEGRDSHKVGPTNRIAQHTRAPCDRQVKGKYLFISCQDMMYGHIIIH